MFTPTHLPTYKERHPVQPTLTPTPPVNFREFTTLLDPSMVYVGAYIYNNQFMVRDNHPIVSSGILARAVTTYLTSQLMTRLLAEKTIFTQEELAGELGGAIPLDSTDPRKPLLLQAVYELVRLVSTRITDWYTALNAELRDSFQAAVNGQSETAFPEIEPYQSMEVSILYTARGGVFNCFAGLAFLYVDATTQVAQERLLYLPDLEEHPYRDQALALVRRILASRNSVTDRHAEIFIDTVTDMVIARVGEAILKKPEPVAAVDGERETGQAAPRDALDTPDGSTAVTEN